jgi:hypothetical protein
MGPGGPFPWGGLKWPGVKLTTRLQLVPRSRKHGSIHPLPHTSSWHSIELVRQRDIFTLLFLLHKQTTFHKQVHVLEAASICNMGNQWKLPEGKAQ